MGEYAKRISDGASVKMGTCEDMYYLRADQRHLVAHERGSVNLHGPEVHELRFRFPWPDEDDTLPGAFDDYDRAVTVYGFTVPEAIKHYTVQFTAQAGYLVSLPCPEGTSTHGLTIHRNGFAGAVQLAAQKLLTDGRLVPVLRCGGCGTMWRCEEPAEIEAVAVAFRAEADSRERQGRHNDTGAADRRFWDAIADRILAGASRGTDLVLSTVEG